MLILILNIFLGSLHYNKIDSNALKTQQIQENNA